MIRSIIVDDELMARESLAILLEKFEDIEMRHQFESAEEALLALKTEEIDLIFLDVEMPGLSGIDMLEVAGNLPKVILTTNKVKYALEAFEYEVVDFLQKPVSYKRLVKAIEKLRSVMSTRSEVHHIFVRSEGKHVRIDLNNLLFIETMDDYVVLRMEDKTKHIVHSTLAAMEQRLPDSTFLKVHRSYVINLEKIHDLDETTVVIDRNVVPVSRAFRKLLRSRLGL